MKMKNYEISRGHNIRIHSTTVGSGEGDVTFIGSGVSVTAGNIYCLKEVDGNPSWVAAENDVDGNYEGLLAVALGTSSSDGMLIRGAVTVLSTINVIGLPLYLHPTAGRVSTTIPTTAGQVVRIIGYGLDDNSNTIYFNPDSTYILLQES
jgi:hypothetical protein